MMAATKKKVTKKSTGRKPSVDNKLHVVLGDLKPDYVAKCESIGMTKSEVGLLLCKAFVDGTVTISPAKLSKKKIKA